MQLDWIHTIYVYSKESLVHSTSALQVIDVEIEKAEKNLEMLNKYKIMVQNVHAIQAGQKELI